MLSWRCHVLFSSWYSLIRMHSVYSTFSVCPVYVCGKSEDLSRCLWVFWGFLRPKLYQYIYRILTVSHCISLKLVNQKSLRIQQQMMWLCMRQVNNSNLLHKKKIGDFNPGTKRCYTGIVLKIKTSCKIPYWLSGSELAVTFTVGHEIPRLLMNASSENFLYPYPCRLS